MEDGDVAKNERDVQMDKTHRLQVAIAREIAANHAIELALASDEYMDLAEMYDSLSLAVCDYEIDLEKGIVEKPSIP
jgi:uncharacterized protein YacL (UPF0231 family)